MSTSAFYSSTHIFSFTKRGWAARAIVFSPFLRVPIIPVTVTTFPHSAVVNTAHSPPLLFDSTWFAVSTYLRHLHMTLSQWSLR